MGAVKKGEPTTMNDYQEYRSYGSYLSRVFAIIIAFLLLIFAIWGVVKLAGDDDTSLGDTRAPSFVDSDEDKKADFFVNGNDQDASDSSESSSDDDPVVADSGDANSDEQGQTLATNTDEDGRFNDSSAQVAGANTDSLPSTGADLNFVLVLGAVAFVGSKFAFAQHKNS